MTRIAVIVPAYNEEKAITAVVDDINAIALQHGISLIPVVVNDCSTDTTPEIISLLSCVSLHLPVNLGIGGAVQTGFRYALENGFDYAVQVDGDGQHPASEIPGLVMAALRSQADVVIGSRFLEKEGFQSSALRRSGIIFFKRLNRLLTGVTVNDSTSGFRLLSRKSLSVVSEYYPDEYPEPEAIVLYAMHGLKITEVPVSMKARQGGVSSIGGASSVYYMFKVSLAILFTFIRIRFSNNKS